MNKNRLEAITDGIIAIAATIGVLQFKMPSEPDLSGLAGLNKLFISYIISYMIIITCWYSHHMDSSCDPVSFPDFVHW